MIDNYNYLVSNWEKYGITDTKQEFIEFLNILESLGENLETFKEGFDNAGCFSSYFFDECETLKDAYETVLYFNTFFTVEDLKEFCYDFIADNGIETAKAWLCNDENPDCIITTTTDGFVYRIQV